MPVLKPSPFGYKTLKELSERVVKPRYMRLFESTTFEEYYDFIFSAGALKEWVISEDKNQFSYLLKMFREEKIFSIFQSTYNNINIMN